MSQRLEPLRAGFFERMHVGPVLSGVAVRWHRRRLAFALALVPALVVFALLVAVPGLARAGLAAESVDALFARFISATATVATIAVSIASLTMGRQLRGVAGVEEHHDANERYRNRVRETGGRDTVPMALGPFLGTLQSFLAEAAARAHARATPEQLRIEHEGVTLAALLDDVETRARKHVARLEDAEAPHEVLLRALDAAGPVSHHLVRRFLRDKRVDGPVRGELEAVQSLLRDADVGTGYAKTINFQWGLSRMSLLILATTLPAMLACVGMVLFYVEPAGAWTPALAAGSVALALLLALLPVTSFVSYLLRFVFINARTLPSADFLLGPELPAAIEGRVPAGLHRGQRV